MMYKGRYFVRARKSPRLLRKDDEKIDEAICKQDSMDTERDPGIRVKSYIVCVDSERFYKGHRFYWTICSAQEPDLLVSWGHARTRELAEATVATEIERLVSARQQCN